ncbi:hypothetical protein [Streptomyces sp. NBC_00151]|nr:hypothetical protein [Streptomyces sp. NBC_00151]WRZ36854.1 hypothetical protein OG915_01435 [Streptomyces sp. NBC_00151]WRZ44724.1 hypothetical protein OG915_46130 [Streptomyces sp. NBC_00151]
MRKVVSRDGSTTPCEKTGDGPATAPAGGTAGGGFTGVRTDDAPGAGSRL